MPFALRTFYFYTGAEFDLSKKMLLEDFQMHDHAQCVPQAYRTLTVVFFSTANLYYSALSFSSKAYLFNIKGENLITNCVVYP